MWLLHGLGAGELLLLLVVTSAMAASRVGRRWMAGVLPCLAVAAVAPPTDPLTMILIATPMVVAFAAGVFLAPSVRRARTS
jgi:Sec-independent protein secretion pathway component TatC